MFEIALSTTCGKIFIDRNPEVIDESFLSDCAESGIKAVEIALGSLEQCLIADLGRIKELADEAGVKLWSFHLPYRGVTDLSSPAAATDENGIKILAEVIKKASDMGIDKYVVHSTYPFRNENTTDAEIKEKMKVIKQNLSLLADIAEHAGGVMAVENLPPTCLPSTYKEHLEILSADDRLRACFDTNHMIGGSHADHIRALGSKLVTLHVSDYELAAEKHWLPGEGKNNWPEIIDALRDINYHGALPYELAFDNPPPHNPGRRDLTCADIARNAKELFNKEKLTVIK